MAVKAVFLVNVKAVFSVNVNVVAAVEKKAVADIVYYLYYLYPMCFFLWTKWHTYFHFPLFY